MRLDVYLVQNGLASGRDRAKEMISSGTVTVNGAPASRPSMSIEENDSVLCLSDGPVFVGRGGNKLLGAFDAFNLSVSDKICLDIGASTGGFTDCMLSWGAKLVYAVDVGHGQLAEKLLCDARVVNLEKTDVRSLPSKNITEPVDFFSVDVSFISLSHIFPAVFALSKDDACGVFLVKPQFEAGPGKALKKGVVKDAKVHRQVLTRILEQAHSVGFFPAGLTYSPICGQNGNIEYLLYVKKQPSDCIFDIASIVEGAHKALSAK